MPDLALDLRYFRYVLLVAEYGSFRKAADALSLSQSTISRRVQLLERRLGASLFDRSRTGVRLTYAGERFLLTAKGGAEQLHRAASEVSHIRQGRSGQIRLGIMASFAAGFLAETLRKFRSLYPDVEVLLEESSSQLNVAGVLSGRLDAAFVRRKLEVPGCEVQTLWEERVFIALPSSHVLASNAEVRWEEIGYETFLVSTEGSGADVEDYIQQQLYAFGIRPSLLPQKLGRENLLNFVASGFGIALATEAAVGVPYVGVSFVPLADSEPCLWSLVRSRDNMNPALKRFAELCHGLSTIQASADIEAR